MLQVLKPDSGEVEDLQPVLQPDIQRQVQTALLCKDSLRQILERAHNGPQHIHELASIASISIMYWQLQAHRFIQACRDASHADIEHYPTSLDSL